MTRISSIIILFLGLLTFCCFYVPWQPSTTFKIKFVVAKVKHDDNQRQIVAVFHVSAKDSVDFCRKIFYPDMVLINDKKKIVDFKPILDNVDILIQRDQIDQTFTYNLIKDKVDLNAKPFYLMSFILKNLPKEPIKTLIFTFTMKECSESDKTDKKTFEIEVQQ